MPAGLVQCLACVWLSIVLPWEDDEGIQTLLSLRLGSRYRSQISWTVHHVILSAACSFLLPRVTPV